MWGTCPSCSADLSAGTRTRPPYVICPFCCAAIQPAWWQRVVWVAVGFFLAFAFPTWLGLTGWDVAAFSPNRKFLLKDTGRKLAHLDKQFNVGHSELPAEVSDRE
jgi:hypothetical protein